LGAGERERERGADERRVEGRQELPEMGGFENVENVFQNHFALKQIEPYVVCLFLSFFFFKF